MSIQVSHSPAETESIAEKLGRQVEKGTVILLTGDLGAGKTQWVRGLARGLGSPARVHSPTFAVVNLYEGGRLPLAHLDLYRLETPEAIRGAGVEEFLQPDGVSVIEWAERLFAAGPDGSPAVLCELQGSPRQVRVEIEVVNEETRRVRYEDSGA